MLKGRDGNDTLDGDDNCRREPSRHADRRRRQRYLFVDDAGDVVKELAKQGSDTVVSRVTTYTLGANVENLTFDNFIVFSTGTGNVQ